MKAMASHHRRAGVGGEEQEVATGDVPGIAAAAIRTVLRRIDS